MCCSNSPRHIWNKFPISTLFRFRWHALSGTNCRRTSSSSSKISPVVSSLSTSITRPDLHSRVSLSFAQTRARSLKMFSRSFAGRRRQRLTNLIKMMWVFSRVQFKLSVKNIFSHFHLRSPASGYWLRGLPKISRHVLGLRDSERTLEAPLFIFFTTLSIPGYR